jgi:carbonic anhydrase
VRLGLSCNAWFSTGTGEAFVFQRPHATRQNVIDNIAKLKSATPILSAAVEEKKLKVVGGIYRLKNGKVEMVA